MLKNKFEARNYLKYYLCCDRNNNIKEIFYHFMGFDPLTSYDVIFNDSFLKMLIEDSKQWSESENEIKETIKEALNYSIENCYF